MLVGKALGPYVIDREIGHGAMGTVYHGFEHKTNKPVALKIVSAGLDSNSAALARFERECEFLKRLRHPNIVR